jgi:hypothetical protein
VGDLLEAEVNGKQITLTPKIVVDRAFVEKRLAEGLADLKAGRTYGPFSSARDAVRSLRREAKRLKKPRSTTKRATSGRLASTAGGASIFGSRGIPTAWLT